jgi:hypothetical protein
MPVAWEEAWLMVGRLRSEGIPALVHPQDFTALTKYRVLIFDVVAAKDRLEDARRVITDLAVGAAPP